MALCVDDEHDQDDNDEAELAQSDTGEHPISPVFERRVVRVRLSEADFRPFVATATQALAR